MRHFLQEPPLAERGAVVEAVRIGLGAPERTSMPPEVGKVNVGDVTVS
jgi:hypothetical protein